MNQHAIFDLDGTLLDSMELWSSIGTLFLTARGITPPDDLWEHLRANSIPQSAAYFIEAFGVPGTVEEVSAEICDIVRSYYETSIPAKPGVPEYLRRLKEAGVNCCVLTATDKEQVTAALSRLGLLQYFDFILTCTDFGSDKNHPDIFLAAAERLGGTVSDTTVFEDALHAATTAKKAGFRVVGLYEATFDYHEAQMRALCDVFAASFENLPLMP